MFVRAAETGSFSKASADLGVTQPTATKHVAALEGTFDNEAKLTISGVPATDVRVRAPATSLTNCKLTPLSAADDDPDDPVVNCSGSSRRWTWVLAPIELR